MYRIYRASDITSVDTRSQFVTMKLESDGRLVCVGTGSSPEQIRRDTYLGRLGHTMNDKDGREYIELFSGEQ